MTLWNTEPTNQPYPWSIAVLRVAAGLENQYEIEQGHFYRDEDGEEVNVVPDTVSRSITISRRDEGSYTIARPNNDLTWQVDTWLTARVTSDPATMTLALAVLADRASETPPNYTDIIDPAIFDDINTSKPRSGHARVAHLIFRVIDLHIQQHEKDQFAALAPGAALRSHGGAVPFQAYGTWHDYEFYFRYRGGLASLRIGTSSETVVGQPLWSAHEQYGPGLDGYMDFHEFLDVFARLAAHLETNPGGELHPGVVTEPAPDIFRTVRG
jgi:hypothetical protein